MQVGGGSRNDDTLYNFIKELVMPSGRPEEWKAKQPSVGTEEFNKLMRESVNIVYLLF